MPDRPEVFLERMTWPDVEAAIAAGRTRALICVAATEQHGPHLPEGTDALLGEELARRLAHALGDALVAPIIRPGCSEHHMGFAGTISVSADVLTALLDAYLESLSRHGFQRFLVFTSHGGNLPALATWPGRRRPEVTVLDDLHLAEVAIRQAPSGFGAIGPALRHAGLAETAAMLAIRPELVRMERAQAGFDGELRLDELMVRGVRTVSPNGAFGDPTGATAEMGAAVLAAWTDSLLGALRDVVTAALPEVSGPVDTASWRWSPASSRLRSGHVAHGAEQGEGA